jgi:hypothetical protein
MEGCEGGGGGLSGTAVQDSCGGRPRLVRAHDRAVTAGIGERGQQRLPSGSAQLWAQSGGNGLVRVDGPA